MVGLQVKKNKKYIPKGAQGIFIGECACCGEPGIIPTCDFWTDNFFGTDRVPGFDAYIVNGTWALVPPEPNSNQADSTGNASLTLRSQYYPSNGDTYGVTAVVQPFAESVYVKTVCDYTVEVRYSNVARTLEVFVDGSSVDVFIVTNGYYVTEISICIFVYTPTSKALGVTFGQLNPLNSSFIDSQGSYNLGTPTLNTPIYEITWGSLSGTTTWNRVTGYYPVDPPTTVCPECPDDCANGICDKWGAFPTSMQITLNGWSGTIPFIFNCSNLNGIWIANRNLGIPVPSFAACKLFADLGGFTAITLNIQSNGYGVIIETANRLIASGFLEEDLSGLVDCETHFTSKAIPLTLFSECVTSDPFAYLDYPAAPLAVGSMSTPSTPSTPSRPKRGVGLDGKPKPRIPLGRPQRRPGGG